MSKRRYDEGVAEPFVLRPMEEADIEAAAAIEDASELPERSLEARRNELGEERMRGVVLEVGGGVATTPTGRTRSS